MTYREFCFTTFLIQGVTYTMIHRIMFYLLQKSYSSINILFCVINIRQKM